MARPGRQPGGRRSRRGARRIPTTVLITGVCGFVGRVVAEQLLATAEPGALAVVGIDNLSRPAAWLNREPLRRIGVRVLHGDIRNAEDLESAGRVDWVIDAAANPSVLAGIDGRTSSRQLVQHNLVGTLNLLELCKAQRAGFILLSTSRVYSIAALAGLELEVSGRAFRPAPAQAWPIGVGPDGVAEHCSTEPPLSLYGTSKRASELVALEYGEAFGFPVWVNRCGVLAGGGQFGRADQGIFSFWIHSWRERRPLRFIGFGGEGHQARDCLHPRDLVPLLRAQMASPERRVPRVCNVAGGIGQAMSLRELSDWCAERFGAHHVAAEPESRAFDVPWMVLDAARAAGAWGWRPQTPLPDILAEIAAHAERHPDWVATSAGP